MFVYIAVKKGFHSRQQQQDMAQERSMSLSAWDNELGVSAGPTAAAYVTTSLSPAGFR